MICLAFVFFAFALGWLGVPELARLLLERRHDYRLSDSGALLYPASSTSMPRLCMAPLQAERFFSALALACMAIICGNCLDPLPSSLVLLGFALMEVACICDLRARIIPWELCLAALGLAVPYCLARDGVSGLLCSILLAVALLVALACCNVVSRRLHSSTAIGIGDLRLMPALCLFGGLEGSLLGMFSCALLMGGYAILALAMKWATPQSGVPLAPGLALWFALGSLSCAFL